MFKVTRIGSIKSGSGITIGTNKPASPHVNPVGVNLPAAQIGGGGASSTILGPGGTRPVTPAPGSVIVGSNRPVGPGGVNPLSRAADRVVNSLYGTGSLTASTVHVNSIQSNINEALNIANQFNNQNLRNQLLNAQNQFKSAVNSSGAARDQALQNVRAAMNQAHIELTSMGYSGGKSPMGQVSTPNIGRLFR
jgi:hypothetical protein